MLAQDLRGVIPAIVTPFTQDEQLDKEGLRKITSFVIENRVHGIMTHGGNGEFPHLLREEKQEVTRVVVDEAKGKVPVIACTSACGTMETILLTKDAKEAGANAVIITPPYYFQLGDESLYGHYAEVARNVDISIVVYNNPFYTGNNLSPKLIARLAEIDGIIGVKQSNSDLGRTVEAIRLTSGKFPVLTGIDSQFYPSLCVGAKGIFSTAACVVPQQMVEVFDAFNKGDHETAKAVHYKLQALNRFLEYDPGYVQPCKEALRLLGLPGGAVRKPLLPLNEQQKTQIKDALADLGHGESWPLTNIKEDE